MLHQAGLKPTEDRIVLGIVIAAVLLHIAVSAPLFDWLIDDAGISFAYSRSLGTGQGLTCQPGVPPVEGYSNFLWVVLMAPFFTIGLFDPYIVSKVISLLLVALTYWTLCRIITTMTDRHTPAVCMVLLLLPVTTPFVVWSTSGLENPLFALLISLLTLQLLKFLKDEQASFKRAVLVGSLAGLVGLTRPDGPVYVTGIVVLAVAGVVKLRGKNWYARLKPGLISAGSWILLYGGYLVFRRLYFGYWHPNTYYAKGGPGIAELVNLLTLQQHYLLKIQEFLIAVTGKWMWLGIPVILVLWLVRSARDRTGLASTFTLLIMLGSALAAYALLPKDWMSEYRFATPIFPLLYVSLALAAHTLWEWLPSSRWLRLSTLTVFVVIALSSVWYAQGSRLATNLTDPPRVPLDNIKYNFGRTFDRYAEHLGLKEASFLVPDLGGTLYYSRLRVYDLAGLCDPVIPRTRGKNQQAFYDYIFDSIRPTFIHTHGTYTLHSKFDEDPRFERDYVPITQYEDTFAENYIGRKIMSGNFIRRDVVEGKEDLLADLRDGTVPYGW